LGGEDIKSYHVSIFADALFVNFITPVSGVVVRRAVVRRAVVRRAVVRKAVVRRAVVRRAVVRRAGGLRPSSTPLDTRRCTPLNCPKFGQGEFHDQEDVKWIVIIGHPGVGRPGVGRPGVGRPGVGRPQGICGGFSYY
jgi:hypothetical protein